MDQAPDHRDRFLAGILIRGEGGLQGSDLVSVVVDRGRMQFHDVLSLSGG